MSNVQDQALPAGGDSPGARLRQAREAAGLDLDTLAANLRVSAAKLALLESDRHAELPDPAFARALALTVCRALHIDPAPVLAGLPQSQQGPRLEQVNQGLNQPFGPRRSWLGAAARLDGPRLQAPAAVAAALLVLGALVVYFWPQIQQFAPPAGAGEPVSMPATPSTPAPSPPGEAASAAISQEAGAAAPAVADTAQAGREAAAAAAAPAVPASAAVVVAPEPAAPAVSPAPLLQPAHQLASAPAVPAAASAAPLLLRTTAPSWVEVRDAAGRPVLSRQLAAGEAVSLAGTAPWRIKIGNAGATELSLRGQRVDLAPHTRNNVARLELN